MDVIVLGAGEVGSNLCQTLNREGHRVVVVDCSTVALERLGDICDVQSVEGNASDRDTLLKAGVRTAQLLLAVTSNDEINLLSCHVARSVSRLTTVARIKKEFYLYDAKGFYRNTFQIDHIVCPEILAGMEAMTFIGDNTSSPVEFLADGRVEARRIRVTSKMPIGGGTVSEIDLPKNLLIGTIKRGDKVIIPRGSEKIDPGDEIFVIGTGDSLAKLEKKWKINGNGSARSGNENIIILGGGLAGRVMSAMFSQKGINVKIIEEDPEVCREISCELAGVQVLCGDATDYKFLYEEGIGQADVFIATCKNDETNLLASLLARDMGVEKIVTIVSRPGYRPILKQLGFDGVISPRYLTAKVIMDFIRNHNTLLYSLTASGDVLVMETFVESGSRVCGRKLREIEFPPHTLVGCVIRGEDLFIPTGEDTLENGDDVITIVNREQVPLSRSLF